MLVECIAIGWCDTVYKVGCMCELRRVSTLMSCVRVVCLSVCCCWRWKITSTQSCVVGYLGKTKNQNQTYLILPYMSPRLMSLSWPPASPPENCLIACTCHSPYDLWATSQPSSRSDISLVLRSIVGSLCTRKCPG